MEVAVTHITLVVEVRREDAGILKDRAVLDDGVVAVGDLHHFLKPFVEEVDLKVE